MRFLKLLLTGALCLVAPISFAEPDDAVVPAEPTIVELAHRLDEIQAERLQPVIDAFNDRQAAVRVRVVRRVEGQAPRHLNLVTRDEHARFLAMSARFMPFNALMQNAGLPFDADLVSPELKETLTDENGQLLALPFAFSTPVLYINKALFRRAKLDPASPPTTWAQVQEAAGQLARAGSKCPFTTSWPVWIMIDNSSVWNGAPLTDDRGRLAFDGRIQIKHIAMMAAWHKSGYFRPFGHADEADWRFSRGECAMLTSASSAYPLLRADKTLDVGISALPYHDDLYGVPKNTLSDGASLWVANDLSPDETRAAAAFIHYVLSPPTQIAVTVAGGFLPMMPVARATAASELLKEELASLQVVQAQLHPRTPMPRVRPSQIEPVRQIIDSELEAVWANEKSAKEALEAAVLRGNALLFGADALPRH